MAQKRAIYHVWKVALSIPFDPVGDGRYRFDYLAAPRDNGVQGLRTAGIVNADGSMVIEQQAAAGEPVCPICLARGRSSTRQPAQSRSQVCASATRSGRSTRTAGALPGTVIALGLDDRPRPTTT